MASAAPRETLATQQTATATLHKSDKRGKWWDSLHSAHPTTTTRPTLRLPQWTSVMTMPHETLATQQSATATLRKRRWILRWLAMLLLLWLLTAYLLLPVGWRIATRRHPALEGMPRITLTANGIHGDPLNISFIGTEEEVDAAMLAAGWFPADPITLKSSLRIAAGTILRRSYETAPVSNLFLWGRKQDLAFQQPVGKDPRRRHHVRFWRSEQVDENNRPLWAGAATFDTHVGFSHTTGQITHHIDGNVDAERDKLLADLVHAGVVANVDWLDGFHEKLQGRNGGGDPWYTDGRMPVVTLVPGRNESHIKLGVDMDQHIQFVIDALKPHAEELGIGGTH